MELILQDRHFLEQMWVKWQTEAQSGQWHCFMSSQEGLSNGLRCLTEGKKSNTLVRTILNILTSLLLKDTSLKHKYYQHHVVLFTNHFRHHPPNVFWKSGLPNVRAALAVHSLNCLRSYQSIHLSFMELGDEKELIGHSVHITANARLFHAVFS